MSPDNYAAVALIHNSKVPSSRLGCSVRRAKTARLLVQEDLAVFAFRYCVPIGLLRGREFRFQRTQPPSRASKRR